MELLHVVGWFPPHLGGEELVVEQLSALQSQSNRVTVYTSNLGARSKPLVVEHQTVGGALRVVRQRAVTIFSTPVIPGLGIRLLRHQPKPDILHVHTGQALVPEVVRAVAGLRGVRYVAHQHLIVRPSSRLGDRLLPLYDRLLFGNFLQHAARVICLTSVMREDVIRKYALDPSRVVVVANGVDLEFFGERNERRSDNELLFVGRLTAQKNVDAVLEAALLLGRDGREITVRIIGDGPERERLSQTAARWKLTNVSFEGRQSSAYVAEAYSRATMLVMPSTHEGMPLVLLEAMAAGLPVVASELAEILEIGGDAIELIREGSGGAELAAAVTVLLDDRFRRAELSLRGRARVREASWRNSVDGLQSLYESIKGS